MGAADIAQAPQLDSAGPVMNRAPHLEEMNMAAERKVQDVVIIGAARTPIGAFQGSLSSLPAPRLGAAAIQAALQRAGLKPEQVDAVLMGCVLQGGLGQAPARQAAIYAGLPD